MATLFFPSDVANDTLELYKFVRIPDQVVDGEVQNKEMKINSENLQDHYKQANIELRRMKNERTKAYQKNNKKHILRGDSVELFYRKEIPFHYSEAFFDAMIRDTAFHEYKTYDELREYMFGSASVIGLMMCHVIGCSRKALEYAGLLGEAMQLSNFLRDVCEDYELLGRIYLPEEDLQCHGLTHQDIKHFCRTKKIDDRFASFMRAYIAMNREQYAKALEGVKYLHPRGRKAVFLASKLYEGILERIESNKYNVFQNSCRTTKRDKARLLTKGLINYMYH